MQKVNGNQESSKERMAIDSGISCLCLVARFHRVAADPNQLQHEFVKQSSSFVQQDLLRAAKYLDLKSRAQRSDFFDLGKLPLPVIARTKDNEWIVIGKTNSEQALVHNPLKSQPELFSFEQLNALCTGDIILITRRTGISGLATKFDLSWFVPALAKYKKLLLEVLLASFFIQLLALISPLFFQVVIDKVLVHRGLTTLDVLCIGFLIVITFEVILSGLRTYLFSHTTNRIDVELGSKLYRHLTSLPVGYFVSRPAGNLVARVKELDTIRSFITGSALTLLMDLLFSVIFFIVMYLFSPALFWIVLATIPAYIMLAIYVTPILKARLNEKFLRGAENQAFLTESITGVESIKSLAVEPQFRKQWDEQLAGYVSASFKAANLNNVASQIAGFFNKLTTILVLWFGARLVIRGELSVGQLIAFNMFAARVSGPILRLVQLWQDFQQVGISIERLGDILNAPTEPGHNPNRTTLASIEGQVNFSDVTFRYSVDHEPVLKNVSFQIKPGEVIGIVGRSGSGKSTITKLIQRLYLPESGNVEIDGVDLSSVDTAWLRKQIGVVLQENFLFNRTVRDNIALADPGMPIDTVMKAAKMAGAHEFITQLPQGYDTVIEENGANLSGGQKQRLAIARALITDPKILILDEATSALDYESERIIQDNMRYICQGRTVFIIAHRLSTVRNSNRIFVVDKGKIVEQGSHTELLKRKGYYANLYHAQVE